MQLSRSGVLWPWLQIRPQFHPYKEEHASEKGQYGHAAIKADIVECPHLEVLQQTQAVGRGTAQRCAEQAAERFHDRRIVVFLRIYASGEDADQDHDEQSGEKPVSVHQDLSHYLVRTQEGVDEGQNSQGQAQQDGTFHCLLFLFLV